MQLYADVAEFRLQLDLGAGPLLSTTADCCQDERQQARRSGDHAMLPAPLIPPRVLHPRAPAGGALAVLAVRREGPAARQRPGPPQSANRHVCRAASPVLRESEDRKSWAARSHRRRIRCTHASSSGITSGIGAVCSSPSIMGFKMAWVRDSIAARTYSWIAMSARRATTS